MREVGRLLPGTDGALGTPAFTDAYRMALPNQGAAMGGDLNWTFAPR